MNLAMHPLSSLFPPLPPAALAALKADIKKHGVRFPITIYEGKILDGAHRYQVCMELGIKPRIVSYKGKDPARFVYSANAVRRHLTGGQLSHILAILSRDYWAKRGGDRDSNGQNVPFEMTTTQIAKEAKVSSRTVKGAKKVIVNGSAALNAAVRDGEISVTAASEIADLPKKAQAKAIKEAKAPKEAPDHPAMVSWEKYHELEERYDEMASNYEVLADQAKTADALMKSDAAIEMMKLREELKVCRRSRDDAMNRAAEIRKQCNWWKKVAVKHGYKPEAKK